MDTAPDIGIYELQQAMEPLLAKVQSFKLGNIVTFSKDEHIESLRLLLQSLLKMNQALNKENEVLRQEVRRIADVSFEHLKQTTALIDDWQEHTRRYINQYERKHGKKPKWTTCRNPECPNGPYIIEHANQKDCGDDKCRIWYNSHIGRHLRKSR